MERFHDLTDAFDALVFPDAIPLEARDLRSPNVHKSGVCGEFNLTPRMMIHLWRCLLLPQSRLTCEMCGPVCHTFDQLRR